MNTIKEVISEIKTYAENFSIKSVGSIMPEMCTDCYMNVRNWLNTNLKDINGDPGVKSHARELDMFVNNNWTWDNDSVQGQKTEVQEALIEIYNIIKG